MFAQCPNDLVAIIAAREAARKGQAIEVWRGDRLIYKVGPRWDRRDAKARKPEEPRTYRKLVGWVFRLPSHYH